MWYLQVVSVIGCFLISVCLWFRLRIRGLVSMVDWMNFEECCSNVFRCVFSFLNWNGLIMQLLVLVVRFLILFCQLLWVVRIRIGKDLFCECSLWIRFRLFMFGRLRLIIVRLWWYLLIWQRVFLVFGIVFIMCFCLFRWVQRWWCNSVLFFIISSFMRFFWMRCGWIFWFGY